MWLRVNRTHHSRDSWLALLDEAGMKVSRMRITLMLYGWKHLHLFMRYLVLKTDGLPFRMHQHKVA
ncbi:ribosomal RNA small subunit methyltransferase B [Escherichia coli]|uniref:Ribosomal RNA small subunit methyltransferase B n=1 Tax=Escherichia coli TaxID=562 RepID=A0A376TWE4_ECOLX|nr:ribosomal RNA small subunit methyltransferase B [Escherichia coli]